MIDLTVKIGGEAGFGIMTTGLFLGKMAIRSGYNAFEYSEYPSLIRGGHNVIEVRISDESVYSQEKGVDILVCLNGSTYELHAEEVKENGIIIIDRDKVSQDKLVKHRKSVALLHLPLAKMIQEAHLDNVMMNNIALGALTGLLSIDIEILHTLIEKTFAKKTQEVIDKNMQAARLGYDAMHQAKADGYSMRLPKKDSIVPKIFVTGNEAVGLGAIAAGCKFYVAYPMTPSSALLHYLAAMGEKVGMVVKHAEDEISVINMAIGASWAGVRSMVGTSGGGFALMVEALSLAGITETPLVVMLGQRPGPATGMPTWTEQGDLLFALHAGHGEFPKILLAPGDMEEAYALTIEAFRLADLYQTPVILLGDKYILEGHASVEKSRILDIHPSLDRGKLLRSEDLAAIQSYKRYEVTDDGISSRVIPGTKNGVHQANSYEHLEDGHTTEDAMERIRQVDKRARKMKTFLKNDSKLPTLYGNKDAALTLVSWGSLKAPILQAMKNPDASFNYLHFSYMWPLPQDELRSLLAGLKKTLLVENNATAQLGQLIRMVTGIEFPQKLLKYSGRPIYPEEILEKVRSLS